MSRYEDIDNAIWDDPPFADLSADATLLYLWSFTNPRCGMAGLYKTGYRAMTESKVPADRIATALAELAATGFAFYEESVLWVRSRVKHLRSRSPKMARSVANDLLKLPAEHPLRGRFLEEYASEPWLRSELKRAYADGIETLSEKPIDTDDLHTLSVPSLEGPGTGTGLKEEEAEKSKKRSKRKVVDPHSLPFDFPSELEPRVRDVLPILLGVHAERGGNEPTVRGVALAVRRFPKRDHVGQARAVEHWSLAGTGQSRPLRDVVQLYANFLDGSPDSAPMRSRPNGRVETSDEFMARRAS